MVCWVLPCVSGLSTKMTPYFSSHFRFSQLDSHEQNKVKESCTSRAGI